MTPAISPASISPKRARWPFFLLALIALIGGGVFLNIRRKNEEVRRWKWAKIALPERFARVPASWSAQTLATRLEKSKKLRDAPTFLEAADQIGLQLVASGGYLLPKTADPLELARAFKNGPTHQQITFPEGFTLRQIAARLQKNGFAGAKKLAQVPPAQLEGRLFPDTYWLPIGGDEKAIAAAMTARFKTEIARLPRPFPAVDGKPLSELEIVTLASLIEREAASRAEMPLIAGVLIGRLRRPMRLQVDASIQYARLLQDQNHKSRLLFADLKIDSPYNTYRNDGLPPAPICNPGVAALRAAARPQKTDALFYTYSPRLKKHVFAPTFEGHKRNNALARRERETLEKQREQAELQAGISD